MLNFYAPTEASEMTTYILFAYDCYYPQGGPGDIRWVGTDYDEAVSVYDKWRYNTDGGFRAKHDYVELWSSETESVIIGGRTF